MSNCQICGTPDDVHFCLSGPWQMWLCENCRKVSPMAADFQGNRPERFDDIQRRRFADGLADIAKLLDRRG